MDFARAYMLSKSMGFTFKFDELNRKTMFNDVHVLWRGTEFGTMHLDSMVLRLGDGYVHQFNYYGLFPDSQVREVAEKFIERFESAHDVEKRARVGVIREYFDNRRQSRMRDDVEIIDQRRSHASVQDDAERSDRRDFRLEEASS